MPVIITIIFILFGIFTHLYWNYGNKVFYDYKLKDTPLLFGPGFHNVIKYLKTHDDPVLKKKLRIVLLFRILSILFFVTPFILAILSGLSII